MTKHFVTEGDEFRDYTDKNKGCLILRNADGSADVLTGSDIAAFLDANPANQIEAQQ